MASELNEILDSLKKIKELVKDTEQTVPITSSKDREGVLELALEELRIIYARLDVSQATIKLRVLTFLGAGLALLSYLFSTRGDLFIPSERYGKVFYFIGLGLIISAISMLLHALRPGFWAVPIADKDTQPQNSQRSSRATG